MNHLVSDVRRDDDDLDTTHVFDGGVADGLAARREEDADGGSPFDATDEDDDHPMPPDLVREYELLLRHGQPEEAPVRIRSLANWKPKRADVTRFRRGRRLRQARLASSRALAFARVAARRRGHPRRSRSRRTAKSSPRGSPEPPAPGPRGGERRRDRLEGAR